MGPVNGWSDTLKRFVSDLVGYFKNMGPGNYFFFSYNFFLKKGPLENVDVHLLTFLVILEQILSPN